MSDSAPQAARSTGLVKWFNPKKGYGFITPSEGDEEVFVHQSDIDVKGFRSLLEGSEVEFTGERSADGRLKATQVTGPGGAPAKIGPRPFVAQRARRHVDAVQLPMQYMYPGSPYAMAPAGVQYMYGTGTAIPQAYGGLYPARPLAQGGAGMMAPTATGMPPFGQGVPMGYYSMGAAMMAGGGAERVHAPWRVVVHNLPWETSDDELLGAFAQWNPQEATIMKDRKTGYSKGYGLVSFLTEADMMAAIAGRHGTLVGDPGRVVSVRPDQHM